MKSLKCVFFLLLIGNFLYSQINITEGKEDKSNIEFTEQEPVEANLNGRKSSKDSMRNSLRNFDFETLSGFLIKGLKSELPELKKVLDGYAQKFNSKGKVYFKDSVSDGFSTWGTSGYARFESTDRQLGTLEIMYSYKGLRPRINKILVVEEGKVKYEFPQVLDKIEDLQKEIKVLERNKNYDAIINAYLKIIQLSSKLEDYFDNPNNGLSKKSQFHGSLSWYLILNNKPDEAIKYAEKGLDIWRFNEWINTNLVLGYVLKDDFEKASAMYKRTCGNHYKSNKSYADVFLNDLKKLKSENLKIPRYSAYIQLLEECKSK